MMSLTNPFDVNRPRQVRRQASTFLLFAAKDDINLFIQNMNIRIRQFIGQTNAVQLDQRVIQREAAFGNVRAFSKQIPRQTFGQCSAANLTPIFDYLRSYFICQAQNFFCLNQ